MITIVACDFGLAVGVAKKFENHWFIVSWLPIRSMSKIYYTYVKVEKGRSVRVVSFDPEIRPLL